MGKCPLLTRAVVGIVLAIAGPLRAQPPATNLLTLSLPGLRWALQVPAAGCEELEKSIAPDRKAARFHAEHEGTGLLIAGFLEQAPKPGNARDCRDHYWGKAKLSPEKKEAIRLFESGDVALVEYMVRSRRGQRPEQKNINAYLAKDGCWMEVHIAKAAYTTNDDASLKALVGGIAINERYVPTARDHFLAGYALYQGGGYKLAIAHLEKARALEQIHTSLKPAEMVELLLQLGVGYGASGQLDKAKEILGEGLQRDPDHPMLHYNLACTHAEAKDLEGALAELRLAFRHRYKLPRGAHMPDPLADSSFAAYAAKPEFRQAVKELKP